MAYDTFFPDLVIQSRIYGLIGRKYEIELKNIFSSLCILETGLSPIRICENNHHPPPVNYIFNIYLGTIENRSILA